MIITEPIDQTHADCIKSALLIREYVQYKRAEIAKWQLPPFPKEKR